ncbi:MAG: porphobilinogen synthase [Proteobacteria bacterium]|nr:porphobilinogen synthase [Pseudomonadota bacterium]
MIQGSYPHSRLRRLRDQSFIRNLVAEHQLTHNDFILPLFVMDKPQHKQEIPSMPEVYRLGFKEVLQYCHRASQMAIPAVVVFPVISDERRSLDAREALREDALVCRMVKAIKKDFPHLGVITDVALDPYTSHGHDGLLSEDGTISNDATVRVLKEQALCHAASGADIVAPSDMMDGRIGSIRCALESRGFVHTKILAYSAKYASSLYSPFRDGLGSHPKKGPSHKHTYQLSVASKEQAMREALQDIDEGADILMVKPAGYYTDIIHMLKHSCLGHGSLPIPIFGYHVSGEYSMIKAAAKNGWIDEKQAVLECMLSLKRSGCSAIVTYYALHLAAWIGDNT